MAHLAIAAISAIALSLALWACRPTVTAVPKKPPISRPTAVYSTIVRGFIAVGVGQKSNLAGTVAGGSVEEEIYLPSIEVVLREVGTMNVSPASITSGIRVGTAAAGSTVELYTRNSDP